LNAKQMSGAFYYYPVFGFVTMLGNPTILFLFQISAVLAIVAVMLVMVMSNARIMVALTRMHFLPQGMNRMSNRSIPIYATLLSFFIPMLLSAFPSYYYQYVIIGAIIGTGLPRLIDLASYLKIRKRKGYKPAFRVRFGVAITAIAFIGLAISEISLGASDVLWSLAALVALTLLFLAVDRRYGKAI
ncbi:MAG: APC family permease, partial [Candidatus Micrarchaeota archaeon]|nr:APC family permease [Candidatus Micrarchaeota archaeon]